MIQQILFLAIIGFAAAHLYKSWSEIDVEGFELDGLLDAQTADVTVATGKDIFNRDPSRIANVSYKTPGNHGDPPMTPDHDDPRDLPWIASWTPADRAARQGHTCVTKHIGSGPAGTTIHTTSHSCEGGLRNLLLWAPRWSLWLLRRRHRGASRVSLRVQHGRG
jgi:hypothetical protein